MTFLNDKVAVVTGAAAGLGRPSTAATSPAE